MSLNDDGWNEIFSELNVVDQIVKHGFLDITADKIKEISGREPRLMAKIDFREHVPAVMREHGISVLAIENGLYRIGRFDPFIEIPQSSTNKKPISLTFPSDIISMDPSAIYSESSALDAAMISGALDCVFGERVYLTIRGRSRSSRFDLPLNGLSFPVSGVQIEVDGGYEGSKSINLIEAKIGRRDSLSIRQILYPHRSIEVEIQKRKAVKSYICFYEEPVIRFIPVCFSQGMCFADSENESLFTIGSPLKFDIYDIRPTNDVFVVPADCPFPQADNFETVLAILNVVGNFGSISKDDLFLMFDLTMRQISYYTNALRWMGLVSIKNAIIQITNEGSIALSFSFEKKMEKLANIIFREPIFYHALRDFSTESPDNLFVRWGVGGSTIERRMQTVRSWVNFFKKAQNI